MRRAGASTLAAKVLPIGQTGGLGDGLDPPGDLGRVDSGRGQNRTLMPLSTLWPPVFAGEQDVGPSQG